MLFRGEQPAFSFSAIGFLALAVNVAVFFIWTFPANQATANWTEAPPDWESLRKRWEYSHAANALVTFAGFCAIALSALTMRK